MSPPRRTPPANASGIAASAIKRALLASAALVLVWPTVGAAQQTSGPGQTTRGRDQQGQPLNPSPLQRPRPKAPPPANTDGLSPGELYMEADQLTRDDKAGVTTAEGNVEVRYEGRTLRADRLVYQQAPAPAAGTPPAAGEAPAQGVIRAYGHVQVIHDDGTVEYADEITLDDKMQAGVALGFSARLAQDVKLAGASAVRRSADIQELNKAIYTPCPICVGDKPKTPTWSITADRVVEDKVKHVIYYRHARVHVLGVPILYLPLFWHADPAVERASGLLAPRIGISHRRGFSYEQPYLFVLSPSSDLTVSPQFNEKVNPFLNLEYRKRFYSGIVDMRFGYTYEANVDSDGNKFGEVTSRSFVLGYGAFRPLDKWLFGFTAERTSDELIFDKYDIGRVYQSRGPYVADDRRLISQVYGIRQDSQSFASVAAFAFQGLRPGDNIRNMPIVAPLVDTRFDLPEEILGGRLRMNVSAVALTRDQDPLNLNLPGLDSRRLTGDLDWRRSFTSSSGLRVEPYLNVRVDGYNVDDIPTGIGKATTSMSVGRALAVGGADISFPLFRRWRDSTVVLEPLAQIALSPDAKQVVLGQVAGKPIYLDEDSIALEFDETNLLVADKFPGYDLYEDGLRLNVAGRATVLWDDGRRARFIVGRSFRAEPNKVFPERSGLRPTRSDWIVAAEAQPVQGFSLFARARLDGETLEAHRLEAGANLSAKWGSGYVRYLQDDQGINGVKVNNVDIGGDLNVTQHWGISAYGNRDMIQEAWVVRDVGVFYKDECIRVDVFYRREDPILGRLLASDQLSVRLTLATLGGPLYGR